MKMGLGPRIVEILVREARYRPLTGCTVLIGRQSIYLSPAATLAMLRANGIPIALPEHDIEIDRSTLNRSSAFPEHDLIKDTALMRLLGADTVLALDHSDYEGAELVHDLNTPLPSHLHNIADFIVDGSTLDNVFNPALALSNLAAMLRPGGRVLTVNALQLVATGNPYVMMSPAWYLDYFTNNAFADCKTYISVATTPGNVFTINLDVLADPAKTINPFKSLYPSGVAVLAEKAAHSTSDVIPVQGDYRTPAQWRRYRDNLRTIAMSPRPHIFRSEGDLVLSEITGGYLFVDGAFVAHDPSVMPPRAA